MIRRPDLHWPGAAGSLLVVLAVTACVPANADPLTTGSAATGMTAPAVSAHAQQPTTTTGTPIATGSAATTPTRTHTRTHTQSVPTGTTPSPTPKPAATPRPATVRPGAAVITLATLTIRGRAPKTGYDRGLFGQAWADVDRNGCDTRNDVLRRDLTSFTLKAGTHGCLVLKGTLDDPYTGTRISFVRGASTSSAVQIDHVVALSDAWQKGAQRWSATTRTAFANDPLNLLAVDGPTNSRKGDGDAATWLPPRKAVRCSYVARQIAVKHRYGLSVTAAERDAMVRVLAACPGQALPSAGVIALGGGRQTSAPAPGRPATTTPPRPSGSGATDPRFGTCREAIAAGYGPYRRGTDPEFGWYQDRDHDGLVCERCRRRWTVDHGVLADWANDRLGARGLSRLGPARGCQRRGGRPRGRRTGRARPRRTGRAPR